MNQEEEKQKTKTLTPVEEALYRMGIHIVGLVNDYTVVAEKAFENQPEKFKEMIDSLIVDILLDFIIFLDDGLDLRNALKQLDVYKEKGLLKY